MANRTVADAKSVRGTNPQNSIEKIIRFRVYDSQYWKEECFGLTSELLVDKAIALRYIGGVYGGHVYPTPFLCLVLKMLQIQPEKEIVIELIKHDEFKYVRALGAFYMRLIGSSLDCYKYLEPLLNDYRKLRRQTRDGQYELVHMDEFIDELLREERLCEVMLSRIQKRHVLEESNELEPRVSALEDDLEGEVYSEDEKDTIDRSKNRKPSRRSLDNVSSSRIKERERSRKEMHQDHKADHKYEKYRKRERSRSRSKNRRKKERERRYRQKKRSCY